MSTDPLDDLAHIPEGHRVVDADTTLNRQYIQELDVRLEALHRVGGVLVENGFAVDLKALDDAGKALSKERELRAGLAEAYDEKDEQKIKNAGQALRDFKSKKDTDNNPNTTDDPCFQCVAQNLNSQLKELIRLNRSVSATYKQDTRKLTVTYHDERGIFPDETVTVQVSPEGTRIDLAANPGRIDLDVVSSQPQPGFTTDQIKEYQSSDPANQVDFIEKQGSSVTADQALSNIMNANDLMADLAPIQFVSNSGVGYVLMPSPDGGFVFTPKNNDEGLSGTE